MNLIGIIVILLAVVLSSGFIYYEHKISELEDLCDELEDLCDAQEELIEKIRKNSKKISSGARVMLEMLNDIYPSEEEFNKKYIEKKIEMESVNDDRER